MNSYNDPDNYHALSEPFASLADADVKAAVDYLAGTAK